MRIQVGGGGSRFVGGGGEKSPANMSSRENVYFARICEVIVREYMRETVFFNIKDKLFSEIGHFHGTAFFEAGPAHLYKRYNLRKACFLCFSSFWLTDARVQTHSLTFQDHFDA